MRNVNQEEWRELIANDSNATIIDVRTPQEWNAGIIEGSILINIQNAAGYINDVKNLNLSNNFYLYCRSGGRSQMGCQILESLGVENTFNLQGGIMMWNGKIVSSSNK
ncbi:MAG: rhodanese-like domain-containing protein [Flavobacteriaceae bacterium]|nr:rhodanese-like domain-containing protein [Flavobacteriaceae bacterium]